MSHKNENATSTLTGTTSKKRWSSEGDLIRAQQSSPVASASSGATQSQETSSPSMSSHLKSPVHSQLETTSPSTTNGGTIALASTPPLLIPNEHILLTLMHQFQTLSHAIIDNFAYENNSKCRRVVSANTPPTAGTVSGAPTNASALSASSRIPSISSTPRSHSGSTQKSQGTLNSSTSSANSSMMRTPQSLNVSSVLSTNSSSLSLSSSLKNAFADVTMSAYGTNDRFTPLLIQNQHRVLDAEQIENDIRTIIYSSISLPNESFSPAQLSQSSQDLVQPISPLKASFSFSDLLSPTRSEALSFNTSTSLASTLRNSLRRTNSGLVEAFSSSPNNSTTVASGNDWSVISLNDNQSAEYGFLYLIDTFSRISKHCPNAVVEALLEWRIQFDCSPPQHILKRIQKSLKKEKKRQQKEQAYVRLFVERKELAVNYIFLYVLLHVLQLFIQPPLTNQLTDRLLNLAFRHFSDARANHKSATLNPLTESKETVDDMYSQVVGILSTTHFKQIADRFLDEIPYRFSTSVGRHEVVYFIRGMKYLKVRLGDQNSMEFLQRFNYDVLSKAKKSDIKNACCDAGQSFLSPLGLEHEANDDRFFENTVKPLLLYCQKLNKKNKHILHVYPFYSSLLCLCPKKTFLELFWTHVEALFRQYQKTDQKYKIMALDCLLHIYGYYMKLTYPPVQHPSNNSSSDKMEQQREKTERNSCADRVKKLASAIASQHKRTPPNTEQNEALYSAIVDLIVMIANSNIHLAIDFILELLNTDYICSENIYIGLRSLLNILDQSQMKKILSHPQLSSLILSIGNNTEKPLWMINLLHRQRHYFTSLRGNSLDTISDLSIHRHAYNHGTDSVRMQSPFNTYFSMKNNSVAHSTFGATGSSMGNVLSILDVDIMKFQESLSKSLSNILKYCENNMANSAQQKAQEDIFVLALTMIPKLIPNDYTSEGIALLVTNCLIHPSKTIRQHSFQIIQQLMEFYPIIRAMLIEKMSNLVLENTKNSRLIEQLILLMKKWIQLTHSPLIIPLTYGVFKHVTKHKLRVSYIEVVGLVLMSNFDAKIRGMSIEVLRTLRDLAMEATSSLSDHEYILWDDQVSVFDILHKSDLQLIDMVFTSKSHATSYTPYKDLSSFLSTDSIDLISKFLSKFAQTMTHYVPHTSTLAMIEFGGRIQEVDFDSKLYSETMVHQWQLYCEFICGLDVRGSFTSVDYFRPKNRHLHSSRDVYNLILPFLRETTLVSQAVDILGGINPSMLDILFEQLRSYEQDAFNHSAKVSQRRMRKRKDFLKIQISRVYSRLAENIDGFTLDQHEVVVNRFFSFIEEVLNYLSLTSNMYNTDLHPLRFHFFVVVEQVIKKHFLACSSVPLSMSHNKCYRLMLYVIRWTGFGQRDRKRQQEERKFIDQQKEKYKEESAKQKLENHYRQHTEVLKLKSTAAMASLMLLLRISGKQLRSIEQWSKFKRRSRQQHANVAETQSEHSVDATTADNSSLSTYSFPTSAGGTVTTVSGTDTLQSNASSSGATTRKGITSSVYKKLSMLGSGTNILYADTSSEKAYQTVSKASKEMVDQQLLEWIDEALSSKLFSHRTAVECVSNILRNNPNFLPFCIDQCFNTSNKISEGYFHALCMSLKEINLNRTVEKPHKLLPLLIVLVLYMMISHHAECRMDAIELLQLLSDYFFEENAKGDNFAIMISSTIQDANEMLQLKISKKLSVNHPDLSHSVLKVIYSRLEFMPHYDQGMLLKALVPWTSCISLVDDKRRKSPKPVDEKRHRKTQRIRQRTLEMMFEITKVYGSTFSSECEELWASLSEKSGHIQAICAFTISRVSQLDASTFKSNLQFSVAKQIILYLLATDEKETISVLMHKVELQNIRQPSEEELALSDHSMHHLLAHEIVLILLVETAYHSTSIGRHLATLIQHCFINMDHDVGIVSDSCKHLLANLLHQFVLRRLPHNGGTPAQVELLHKVRQLIDHVSRHSSRSLWSQDSIDMRTLYFSRARPMAHALVPEYVSEHSKQRPTSEFPSLLGESSASFKKMRFLLLGVLDTFGEQKELEEDWGRESILWATHCHTSLRMVARSFQIYRCLLPQTNYSHLQLILQTLFGFLKSYIQTNSGTLLYVVLEILESLRALVLSIDSHKLVLFSQLFWLSVALLHSDVIELYNAGLCFMGDILSSFDMGSASVQNVILSTQPKRFAGIQPLLQKGFLHQRSKQIVIQLLNKLTLLNCDPRIVFQCSKNATSTVPKFELFEKGRLLQHILLLVPHLCVALQPHRSLDDSRCSTMAARLALACDRHKLKKIARVFVRYSNGDYTNEDKFLLELRKPLSDTFFSSLRVYCIRNDGDFARISRD
uniref:Uncharacterized protein n=1 Tax=Percolomonas cosmopolitus TaxID=63605 RepID=A0A7S1KTM4_9EUKA|mmetsp:Transcript_9104/g.33594  ORF Transcript_9104/g.33594 Transcript_9104/m.33594 type:complete len:2338 (+) Transcript_9104:350-7363(+)